MFLMMSDEGGDEQNFIEGLITRALEAEIQCQYRILEGQTIMHKSTCLLKFRSDTATLVYQLQN